MVKIDLFIMIKIFFNLKKKHKFDFDGIIKLEY